jgi:hypothetical protein
VLAVPLIMILLTGAGLSLAPGNIVGLLAAVMWVVIATLLALWLWRSKPVIVTFAAAPPIHWAEVVVGISTVSVALRAAIARSSTSILGGGDNLHWASLHWLLAREIRNGRLPTRIPGVVWPYGASLWTADGALATAVGTFWSLITGEATVSYNLALVSAVVSCALAAHRLAGRFTPSRTVRCIGALACALAPTLAIKWLFYYNLCFIAPVIWWLTACIDVIAKRTAVKPVRHGSLLALCFASSGYLFIFGGLAGALMFAGARVGPPMKRAVATMAVAAILLSPFLLAQFAHQQAEASAGARAIASESATNSATPWSALGVPLRPQPDRAFNPFELTVSPGVILIVGLALMTMIRHPLKRPIFVSLGALWLLSLGPRLMINQHAVVDHDWLPFSAVAKLPGLRGVRGPARLSLVMLPLALMAFCIAAEQLRVRLPTAWRRVVAGGAALAIALAAGEQRLTTPLISISPSMRQGVQSLERTPLLILPGDCLDHTGLMTWLTIGAGPMVGCQGFSAALPFASGLDTYRASSSWAALRCTPDEIVTVALPQFAGLQPSTQAVLDARRQLDVGAVIFDRTTGCAADPTRPAKTEAALRAVATVVASDDHYILFRLP